MIKCCDYRPILNIHDIAMFLCKFDIKKGTLYEYPGTIYVRLSLRNMFKFICNKQAIMSELSERKCVNVEIKFEIWHFDKLRYSRISKFLCDGKLVTIHDVR